MLSIVATVLFLIMTIVFSDRLCIRGSHGPKRETHIFGLRRVWSKAVSFLFGVRVRLKGTEHIHHGQNYVYAANHSSYMDIPILLGISPIILRLTLRSSLTRIPIWGWALLVGPFLVLDRTNPQRAQRTIGKAIERIQSGASVLFFPEGTRTRIPDKWNHSNAAPFTWRVKPVCLFYRLRCSVRSIFCHVINGYLGGDIPPLYELENRSILESYCRIRLPRNALKNVRLMQEAERSVRAMLQ